MNEARAAAHLPPSCRSRPPSARRVPRMAGRALRQRRRKGGRRYTTTEIDEELADELRNNKEAFTEFLRKAGELLDAEAADPKARGAASSYDGINWVLSSISTSGGWENVTYVNGKFVAVATRIDG